MSADTSHNQQLTGQRFIHALTNKTLDQVRLNHEKGMDYLTIDLPSQANAEASTMRDYHGRFLFELIQNASDTIGAVRDAQQWARPEGYRVYVELTEQALIVANDGVPFLEKDVESIIRWGETSKDPNKSIGYKGIGFKSVLEVTEAPEVFSAIVQFRFDRKTCYAEVRKIVGHANDIKLPVTRFIFPYSVDRLPESDRQRVQSLLQEEGYATVIRLPLIVPAAHVIRRINEDIDPALLLFLPGIDSIEVRLPGSEPRILSRRAENEVSCPKARDVALYDGAEFVSRWLLFEAPLRTIRRRAIIEALRDDSWKRVSKVGFALAFPLDDKGRLRIDGTSSERLYVYFPTHVQTGLHYRIHADFYIDAARKHISSADYNVWLAREIAGYVREVVAPSLAVCFGQDPRIVQALAPVAATDAFAGELRALIDKGLRKCAFVPSLDARHRSPEQIMLLPDGATVDMTAFRSYFPTADLARWMANRQFPVDALESDRSATTFLLSLGARRLTPADVFRLLDGRAPVQEPPQYAAFYRYLHRWHGQLDQAKRKAFISALAASRCVVIDNGSWRQPHERLYHAKLRQDTPVMPRAAQAAVVHPAAYDAAGTAGPTYGILALLEPPPRDYNAPEIIRSAIMPLFEDDRFESLGLEQRSEVYVYLFTYWKNLRTESADPGVERIKGRVKVPARPDHNRRRDEWLPAERVYFSSYWTGDDRLEQIYESFPGVAFLHRVRGLELTSAELSAWTAFWEWLGVARTPRIVIDEKAENRLWSQTWESVRNQHAHAGTDLWLQYVEFCRQKYGDCRVHGPGYRRLRRSVTAEGLAEFIERGDVEKLQLVYQLLAENWSRMKLRLPEAEILCYRQGCPQYARSDKAPSFFEYLVRQGEWIVAATEIAGRRELRLHRPQQCWHIPATESPAVRNLLPSPSADGMRSEYDAFNGYIGIRSIERATREDLVDILRSLPETYPDPTIAVATGRRTVPRAVAGLTRWISERINNSLAGMATADLPRLAEPPPLAASQGDALRYVFPPDSAFFADDRYHAARWKPHVPFAPLDINWKDAARFLGLKSISEHVTESCLPGADLPAETNRLMERFKRSRPYMLAVVGQERYSAVEEVARYLSSLELVVVDSLSVQRELTVAPYTLLQDNEAQIYLQQTTGRRAGSGGRAPREGVLYVRKGSEEHYDLLGIPIAEFVGIPSLADAFVILLDRGDKNRRLDYLAVYDLTGRDVEAMRQELERAGAATEIEPDSQPSSLDHSLLKQLRQQPVVTEPEPGLQATGKTQLAASTAGTSSIGGW